MKKLTVRCSDEEYNMLLEYCTQTERTQNDVFREMIRKLDKSRETKHGALDPNFR